LFADAAHDDLSGWPQAFHCGLDIGAAYVDPHIEHDAMVIDTST
jgi:hypothetical protein